MGLPAETPVIKAMKLVVAAKKNGWHGEIQTPIVDGVRHVDVTATRNDEVIDFHYAGDSYKSGKYTLFNKVWNMHCASVALKRIEDWPDLLHLMKTFPSKNKQKLIEKYRKLPFETEATPEEIMHKTFGRQIFWYSPQNNKLNCDVIVTPRTKKHNETYRISPVGDRRIYHFIGAQAGFRSVLLDTIIKVG